MIGTPAAPPSASAEIGLRLPPWTLTELLGRGASSQVYLARHDDQQSMAAVKILSAEFGAQPDWSLRFDREVRLLQELQHPGVPRFLGGGSLDDGRPYMMLEYCPGETLAQRLSRLDTLPLAEVIGIAEQALEVLEVAHARGIVHRDLKPANLILGPDGRVKVLDFGIARVRDGGRALTREGITLGTVAYMAPEQALGRHAEVDARTDLFALGAVMFRCLTGRHLHQRDTEGALLAAMASEPAPSLRELGQVFSDAVVFVVDTAVAFSREGRYPDATTLRMDLAALAQDQPPPFASLQGARREQHTVTGDGGVAPPSSLAEQTALALVGQLVAERYRVLELLGVGGMGAVYRAEHIHMRKPVALKVLHREMTLLPEMVARFEREAIAAARIEHPNVATATDFGRLQDGSCYLVLEFVQGQSLRQVLTSEGRLSLSRALRITSHIAAALVAAHAAGIIHRDLKPENVMLPENGADRDFAKVLDFGIAKVQAADLGGQPALTRVGAVFGTPEYMSPEQALGQVVDVRSDLYSLGIMLYEMLEGATPFACDEVVKVLTRHMSEAPAPLSVSVPPAVWSLLLRLLGKAPSERYAQASDLLSALEALRAELPAPDSVQQPILRTASSAAELATSPTLLPNQLTGLSPSAGRSMGTSMPPLLRRRVRVGGRSVPLVVIALFVLGGVILALIVALAVTLVAGKSPNVPAPAASVQVIHVPVAAAPTADPLLERTRRGDLDALKTLEARPAASRTAEQWAAIGRGRARNREWDTMLEAYTEALKLDAQKASDPDLSSDLFRSALETRTSTASLELAMLRLGSRGADLVFAVWSEAAAGRAPRADAKRAKKLIDQPGLRKLASPALTATLALVDSRGCGDFKRALPKLISDGDDRASSLLRRLSHDQGCGFLGLSDCYSCLRGSKALPDAIAAAKSRPAPSF